MSNYTGIAVQFHRNTQLTCAAAGKQTIRIGSTHWYTEQNSLAEILSLSKTQQKPILAVFSATWCGPCQHVKKEVFEKGEFATIARSVIPLYIEQTDAASKPYLEKYRITGYPTFLLLDAEGRILAAHQPERSPAGFREWIQNALTGDTFVASQARVNENPQDQKALLELVGKHSYREVDEKLALLRRSIEIDPDPANDLTHQAMELLAQQLQLKTTRLPEEEIRPYIQKHDREFQSVFNHLFPDHFQYVLKGSTGTATAMKWFNASERYQKTLDYFDAFSKRTVNQVNMPADIQVLQQVCLALTQLGRFEETDTLFTRARQWVRQDAARLSDTDFVWYYMQAQFHLADVLARKGQIARAGEFAQNYHVDYGRFCELKTADAMLKNPFLTMMIRLGNEHGLNIEDCIVELDRWIAVNDGVVRLMLNLDKAKLLYKKGESEAASALLMQEREWITATTELSVEDMADGCNRLAWTLYKLGEVNEATLGLARKSVELKKDDGNLDTLASVLAALGHYEEAIAREKEAMEMSTSDSSRKVYADKISLWQKERKQQRSQVPVSSPD